METITLKATSRQGRGKGPARRLRAAGQLPTVAYGRGLETLTLTVESEALRAILLSDQGRNTIIDLDIEGADRCPVMIRDYSFHPVSRQLLHADFIRIDEHTHIEVEIPFRTIGKAKGELEGGTVLATLRTLRVRCLPSAIPELVEHDVTELEINDVVKVKDLALPAGAEPLLPPDRKIVVVQPPRVETEEEAEGEEGEELAEGEAVEGEDGEAEGKGEDGAPPAEDGQEREGGKDRKDRKDRKGGKDRKG